MKDKNKKQKVQALADIITNLLQQVDIYTQILTKEDYEILDEAKSVLKNKINYKEAGSVMFYALGVNPDTTEDRMKIKTLDALINLMKIRIEYKEELKKTNEENKKRQETINLFRSMGLF